MDSQNYKFGSVCSGIEAASLAFKDYNITPAWFSEISDFPSRVLHHHYPNIQNCGDMIKLPNKILSEEIEAPQIICGGTPCQTFSLAGYKEGLTDERGHLTLEFVKIIDANDAVRQRLNQQKTIVLWENVEGVLKEKNNAFGQFLYLLSGSEEPLSIKKWSSSGVIYGSKRNVVWRVLDAKYFGTPQQRKRVFVVATPKNINPLIILFETSQQKCLNKVQSQELVRYIKNHKIEVFREYTDCLYSAYGTKWNGNAAAYNGGLFVSQNDRIRRLTPLECERLMGFQDHFTNIDCAKYTQRYQALGNSWSVQTVKWIAQRIYSVLSKENNIDFHPYSNDMFSKNNMFLFSDSFLSNIGYINASTMPNIVIRSSIFDIIDTNPLEKLYISNKGLSGILRRKEEKKMKMNKQLEKIMINSISFTLQEAV